jgi:TniQ
MLPVRVAPIEGEAIDSWIEATARAIDLPLGRVLGLLGIPAARYRRFIVRPTEVELGHIAGCTGVSPSRLLSMTLSRYNGSAIKIDATGLVDNRSPFARRIESRFCPNCLAETQGRWQLHCDSDGLSSVLCTAGYCLMGVQNASGVLGAVDGHSSRCRMVASAAQISP